MDLVKILKMVNNLKKQELIVLNKATTSLLENYKDKREIEEKVSMNFEKGDIVSFIDNSNIRRGGVVTKKHFKTLQVTTVDNYCINISSTLLRHEQNPSKKLLKLRKKFLWNNYIIRLIELLNSKNIDLDSNDEVETTSPMGKAFFQITRVFAELEGGIINARTKARIER
jgi:hypothetical protein